ncbi:MAG: conserved exported protein of unknown function [Nitrospira sp.]|nr:MAG: conserved exported protein of unknown function [Nitrospira sp.]
MKSTLKLIIFLLPFLLLTTPSCSPISKSAVEPNHKIMIDPSTRKETLPAWLWYAGTRAYWMEKAFFERFPGEKTYKHTFDEEIAAREGCARLWQKLKSNDGRSDPYLDDLVSIHQTGFMREYVWLYFRELNWSKPADLRQTDFEQWRNIHLKTHAPETKATAIP